MTERAKWRDGEGEREAWRDSRREGGRGGRAAVFLWLLSKGSVASSEQTKYRPQLNRTFPLGVQAFRQAMGEKRIRKKKRSTCSGSVLSLCNNP